MLGSGEVKRFGSHHNALGFFRLLFAALVIVSHTPEIADGDRHREPLVRLFGTISLGDLAVESFFIISGYLVVGSFLNNSGWQYIAKRVLRIYPAFILSSLLCVTLVAWLGGATVETILSNLPRSFLLMLKLRSPEMPTAFADMPLPDLNMATWTISAEFRCYLLVLLLGWLGLFRRRWVIPVAAAAMLTAYGAVPEVGWRHLFSHTAIVDKLMGVIPQGLRLTGVFLCGATFFLWRDHIRFGAAALLLAAAALAMCLSIPGVADAGVGVFGGYLIFGVATLARDGPLSRINNRDDISYGLYLYGWPIEQLIFRAFPGISLVLAGMLTLALASLAGWVSWTMLEKPIIRRFVPRRPSLAPATVA